MEGKSINHLSKVSCITVKPVIFLLSLLFLWVNVQASPACTCDNINWEEAKCPKKNKTDGRIGDGVTSRDYFLSTQVVLVKVTSFVEVSISNDEADSTYKVSVQRFGGESENTLTNASMTLHNCKIDWTTSTSASKSWYVIADYQCQFYDVNNGCNTPSTRLCFRDKMCIKIGDKDTDGHLHVRECNMEQYLSGFFDKSGREHLHDIFKGLSTPRCPS